MSRKKGRQTFEKLNREQALRERRARKEERREAARIAKALGLGLPPTGEPELHPGAQVVDPGEPG